MKSAILLILLFVTQISLAQTKLYKGNILDSKTGKGISHVHIYSQTNNTNGSITNNDGEFAIRLEEPGTLVFSHIGYQTVAVNVMDSIYGRNIMVKMVPGAVDLNEVTVSAKAMSGQEIVLKAIAALKDNHKAEPVVYDFYTMLLNFEEKDSTLHLLEEYVGAIYQNSWSNSSYLIAKSRIGAFSDVGHEKIQTHRVIGADKMKFDNMFKYLEDYLHPRKHKDYTYELIDRALINDRPCYVIRFKTDEDTHYKTGKLYIDFEDYAIVRKTLEDSDGTLENRIDFTKSKYNGKWYLSSAMDFHRLFNDTSADLRYTLYTNYTKDSEDLNVDKSQFQSWSPNDFVIEQAGNFRDEFWGNMNYIPLPQWVELQINKPN